VIRPNSRPDKLVFHTISRSSSEASIKGSGSMLNESPKRTVQFGAFEVKLDTGELRKSGIRMNLQGKPFQILQALLERPGEVVTREELQNRLWPGDSMVDFESGLNTAANRLRLALGDSAENPRFVETVARIGYRFVATVIELPVHAAEPELPASDAPPLPSQPFARAAPHAHSLRWAVLMGAAFLITAVISLALWSAHRPVQPTFQQVTFRSGSLASARFGPDGETILYSANWDAAGNRLYLANTVSPESRALDFKYARLAGVSSSAELALITADYSSPSKEPMLSRVPLNGGAPLTVASGIAGADWSTDGRSLAVFRIGRRESVIEYPIGKVLYRTAGAISDLRISPKGDELAFLEHPLRGDDGGIVKLIDSRGTARDLSAGWASVGGLAWPPSGREIWFTAGQTGIRRDIYAVTLNGALRRIASIPGTLTLFDISKRGRVLLGIDRSRLMMAGVFLDQPTGQKSIDRDLSWFDWSHATDISSDGKLLLFDETGDGGGPNHSVYLRNLQTDSTVRLGDGQAVALSPDLKWALALNPKKPTYLSLLPIGPEAPRTLAGHGLKYDWARYFPDGQRLLVAGSFPGKPLRLFVQPLFVQSSSGAEPVPLNPDIFLSRAIVSQDGKQIAGLGPDGKDVILPASGGEPKALNIPFPAVPLQWSEDGQALFIRQLDSGHTIRIFRYDLKTSQCRLSKELTPPDRGGLSGMFDVVMGNTERSYAYSYTRILSELFVVDGWT
jgi:DNA-binding winged helix-turn-helix (wHTH) protein/dipeptidyl aminopeptidase/acylaminoacyl peptidase